MCLPPSFGAVCSAVSLQAAESEQCLAAAAQLSTVRFNTKLHTVQPDFWTTGVDNSKVNRPATESLAWLN